MSGEMTGIVIALISFGIVCAIGLFVVICRLISHMSVTINGLTDQSRRQNEQMFRFAENSRVLQDGDEGKRAWVARNRKPLTAVPELNENERMGMATGPEPEGVMLDLGDGTFDAMRGGWSGTRDYAPMEERFNSEAGR